MRPDACPTDGNLIEFKFFFFLNRVIRVLWFKTCIGCSGLKRAQPITITFCTCQDSVTVVMWAKFHCDWPNIYYKQEHCKISLNYKFDRNIISGMSACWGIDASGIWVIIGSGKWHQFSAQPLPETTLSCCQLDPWNILLWYFNKNKTISIQEYVVENAVCKI